MKNAWIAWLGLTLAVPAWAQEEPAPEPAPAEAAPAEAPPADAAPAPEAAPAEQAPAAEAPPAEAAPAEAEAPSEPWPVYAGVGYSKTVVSSSGAGTLGTADYDSKFLDVRVGKRLFESVGLEFHYGLDLSGSDSGEIATDRYYGLFLVPTATLFETVELAFPVGYGRGEYNLGNRSAIVKSVAYGVSAELPLRVFGDTMPDLRLTAGWMIYNQTTAARIYGPSFGLRYDFTVPSPGNPFSGVFGWFKNHWPFGGGEAAPAS